MLISLLFLFSAFAVTAQSNGQIVVKKGRYYVDDKQLNNKELKGLLTSNPESAALLKKSKTIVTVGYVLDGVTAAALVVSIGILPAVLGGVLVATPFILVSNKHLKKSIEVYNLNPQNSTPPK